MDKVAKKLNAKFMLAVGDNIYHHGAKDEHDSRFGATFEEVYTPDSLQFDWYVIAGNHGKTNHRARFIVVVSNCFIFAVLQTTRAISPLNWNIPRILLVGNFLVYITLILSLVMMVRLSIL